MKSVGIEKTKLFHIVKSKAEKEWRLLEQVSEGNWDVVLTTRLREEMIPKATQYCKDLYINKGITSILKIYTKNNKVGSGFGGGLHELRFNSKTRYKKRTTDK